MCDKYNTIVKTTLANAEALRDDVVHLFVRSFVRLSPVKCVSHSLRCSTRRPAGASRIVSAICLET